MSIRLGIIGGGVMAEAILSRLIEQQIYAPDAVLVSEPQPQRREFLHQTYKIQVTSDNRETTAAQEVLLLAVKPQILDKVAENLSHLFPKRYPPLIISILAGVTIKRLEAIFSDQAVIRVMPNTPATVGAGITAIAPGKNVASDHLSIAKSIFAAVGQVVEVSENLMDAVTGLSGSGPAFVAMMIEALADGGVAAGLPRPIAAQLALQTVLGTAQLLQDSELHPAQLKDKVTSPGGTTIAGIVQLEKAGFRSAIIEAVIAAKRRSQELGN